MQTRIERIIDSILGSKQAVIRNNCYQVVLTLFLFPLVCTTLGVAGFIVHTPLSKSHTVVALFLSFLILYMLSGKKTGKALACFGAFLLVISLLMVLFSFPFYDEGDGVAYHKPAAIMMADGWNPIWGFEDTKPFDG